MRINPTSSWPPAFVETFQSPRSEHVGHESPCSRTVRSIVRIDLLKQALFKNRPPILKHEYRPAENQRPRLLKLQHQAGDAKHLCRVKRMTYPSIRTAGYELTRFGH